jgi:phosphoribosyl 1,2-cyclic phosphodiesterase
MKFCSLYSGSSGNSIFISSDNTRLLIDAGMTGKSIETALKTIGEEASNINGMFITHEHIDHVKGVGILSRRYNIPIYASEGTWRGMQKSIGKIKDENIKIIDMNMPEAQINDLNIKAYNIPHDATEPCGYTITLKNKKVSVATDLGVFTEDIKKEIIDSDVLLLESNHDAEMVKFGPYPYPLKQRILSNIGHLSNEACGKAIVQLLNDRQKHIVLGHLSNTNNYPELAYATVINVLRENNINVGKDVLISMANRDKPSSYINL